MLRSLELSWLGSDVKGYSLPALVFSARRDVGGCYYHPERAEVLLDETHHDLTRGLIVISSVWPELIPSSIAHEWRHHWQFLNGWQYDGKAWNWDRVNQANYDAAIVSFFTQSRSERDALRFERRKSQNDSNEQWISLLRR